MINLVDIVGSSEACEAPMPSRRTTSEFNRSCDLRLSSVFSEGDSDDERKALKNLSNDVPYLDNNSSTKVHDAVLTELLPFIQSVYGNPGSAHSRGLITRKALRTARERVARCLSCHSTQVFFTSGATESLNWALRCGAECQRTQGKGNHIVTTLVEHHAVIEICKHLETRAGFEVSFCPVDACGLIDLHALENLLREQTILVSIPHANGEIGAVQPIAGAAKIIREKARHALFHVDCSQAVGKLSVSVSLLDADLITIAGHKMYAPKGVGALYVGTNAQLTPLIFGGGQENGMRGGTENVAFCVALGKACEIIHDAEKEELCKNSVHDIKVGTEWSPCARQNMRLTLAVFFNTFISKLLQCTGFDYCDLSSFLKVVGPLGRLIRFSEKAEFPVDFSDRKYFEAALPNTLSLSVRGATSSAIVKRLRNRMCISAGSTCHSSSECSRTLEAIGLHEEWSRGMLRISTGWHTAASEARAGAEVLALFLVSSNYIPSRNSFLQMPHIRTVHVVLNKKKQDGTTSHTAEVHEKECDVGQSA